MKTQTDVQRAGRTLKRILVCSDHAGFSNMATFLMVAAICGDPELLRELVGKSAQEIRDRLGGGCMACGRGMATIFERTRWDEVEGALNLDERPHDLTAPAKGLTQEDVF